MAEDKKTTISNANSYQAIGEFWDNHDLGDYWDKTESAEFEISIGSERKYYPIDKNLSNRLKQIAQKQGISTETLINLWVQEKLNQASV
ncbi:MAG: CopG family antitoxin [Desulfobacteraceae bacterium]